MTAIDPNTIPTVTFNWGAIKWFVSPSGTDGAVMTVGEVVLLPGKGHERHNHPDAEEVLYVLAGEGLQMVEDAEPFAVHAGDVIYVPTAVYHSTINTGWQPLRLLAIYNPGGSELALEAQADFRKHPAGETPGLTWTR